MFLFQFLLVVHAIIAAALVAVILVQKSEGGGLGMGGSPSGLMSARGAADFLTRSTSVLGALFIAFSIGLAVLAAQGRSSKVDTSLARPGPVTTQLPGTPFANGARNPVPPPGSTAAPKQPDNGAVPLAQ